MRHLLCDASQFSINACKFMIAQVILKSDEVLIAIGYSGLSAVWCGVNALAVPRRDVIGRACVVNALNYGDGTGPVYCVAFWLQTGQNILKHFENININTNIIVNHQGPDNLLIADNHRLFNRGDYPWADYTNATDPVCLKIRRFDMEALDEFAPTYLCSAEHILHNFTD